MQDIGNLRQDQIDALRELGNIGSGNAATALAQFLNRKIDMDIPQAKILPFAEIPKLVGGAETQVLGVFLRVLGKISGRFLLLISESTAKKLFGILMPGYSIHSLSNMEDLESSCMREIGNILAGSFLNALSVLTRTPMLNSLPSLSFDMAGALLNVVVTEMAAVSDQVLMIETSFLENKEKLKIHIFLLPSPDSLEILLSSLGVK